jgi:hypothetical protein
MCGVFVGDDVLLDVGFDAARAGLATLCRGGALVAASQDAYGEGVAGLVRVGPLGSVIGMSKLVEVRCRDLAPSNDSVGLALRWEATGPGGGLFPALDADITLTPAGERASRLRLAGTYRPPFGGVGAALDRAVLNRVATATIRAFLSHVADAIAQPPAGGA